jgi:hypothetical protein
VNLGEERKEFIQSDTLQLFEREEFEREECGASRCFEVAACRVKIPKVELRDIAVKSNLRDG